MTTNNYSMRTRSRDPSASKRNYRYDEYDLVDDVLPKRKPKNQKSTDDPSGSVSIHNSNTVIIPEPLQPIEPLVLIPVTQPVLLPFLQEPLLSEKEKDDPKDKNFSPKINIEEEEDDDEDEDFQEDYDDDSPMSDSIHEPPPPPSVKVLLGPPVVVPKKIPQKTGGMLGTKMQSLLLNSKKPIDDKKPVISIQFNNQHANTNQFNPESKQLINLSDLFTKKPPPVEVSTDAMDSDNPPAPPKRICELDDILPLLLEKATRADEATTFTTKFTGHVAQAKRDIYYYLMGMGNKLPPKWEWAMQELQQEESKEERKADKDYQTYLELKTKFEAPLPVPTIVEPKPNQFINTLFSKYNIVDSGKVQISQTTASNAFPPKNGLVTPFKRSFATMNDLSKQMDKNLNNGSSSTQVKERPTKKAKTATD